MQFTKLVRTLDWTAGHDDVNDDDLYEDDDDLNDDDDDDDNDGGSLAMHTNREGIGLDRRN